MAVPERPDTTRHTITWAQLALGMAVFGSATPVSKIVTGAFPVFVGAGLRVAIGALVLLPLVLHAPGALARLSRRDWVLIGLIALFGMFGFTSLMLSYALLGEAFAWTHLAGFAVVFAGVMLISWEHARASDARGGEG